jgi:hypothetical protein
METSEMHAATGPTTRPPEDSLVRDARARDAALGPGIGNLTVDTADRRILLEMYDHACGELDDALDEVERLEKELAEVRGDRDLFRRTVEEQARRLQGSAR